MNNNIDIQFTNRNIGQENISAILYNKNYNQSISIDRKIFTLFVKNNVHNYKSRIFQATFNNEKFKILIKEIQFHPVNGHIWHVDFLKIEPKQTFIFNAKLNILNSANCKGVKEENGHIFLPNKTVKTICNLDNYVENIDCDILNMKKGEVMMCDDLKKNIKFVKNVALVSILDS